MERNYVTFTPQGGAKKWGTQTYDHFSVKS